MTLQPLLRSAGALLLASFATVAAWVAPVRAQAQLPTGYQDQLLVSTLDVPVGLAFLPDGRLITCELKSGRLRMIVNGELAGIDPIGVVDSVETLGQEEGLLSVAVDPRWPAKPFVYVHSTALDSTLRISRLTATGDLSDGTSGNLAIVPGSRRDLIRDIANRSEYHNGGCLRFGPDSMLYVSLGEDANACAASDTTLLNGVVLRLDVRNLPDTPGPPNKALLVPADNPWAGSANLNQRLVYARGLRNPFRFWIDAPTGRLFIGDTGVQSYDEVDLAEDTRVAVPIYVDPFQGTTRLWVTLGVRLTKLEARFVRAPRLKPAEGEGDWKEVEGWKLHAARHVIPVDEFAEVEVRTLAPPNREELRRLCDEHKTREKIVEALSAGRW
jgi:glucose/arabinose dehydrogenase